MNLKKLRALSHCWRWNYHPRIRQESVAEHSYWTAVYAQTLADYMGVDSGVATSYALYHDAEEAITGDLPGPVKRGRSWKDVENDAAREMGMGTDEIEEPYKSLVKAADYISALVFADEELQMGNQFFLQIRAEILWSIGELKIHEADQLVRELGFRYVDARPPIKEMSHL